MERSRWEHLVNLDRPEEKIRECEVMMAETADANERASLLGIMHVAYCQLNRTKEARQALEEMKQIEITENEIRLTAEFCESAFLIQEGKCEEGLAGFKAMLDRHAEALKQPSYRYLYEDIQCRRAFTLVDLSRFEEALPLLREALRFSLDPATGDEQRLHFALGLCFQDAKEDQAAKQEFLHVVRLGIKNSIGERALYLLALLQYKDGAVAQAKLQLETLLRDFPAESSVVPRSYVYQTLSQTFRYFGDEKNEKLYADLAKRS